MLIIKIIKIKCSNPSRILNEHWCIYSCLQIPPRENWFQYLHRVYETAINFSYIAALPATIPNEVSWVQQYSMFKSIYKFSLSVCLFVCLFVSNKRQNGWTDRAQIWPQGRNDDQIFKNLPPSKFDFWKFWKSTEFF